MVCGRVSNLLSAYLDLELTGYEMLAVRHHLRGCSECRADYEALAQVRRLLGALPAVPPRAGGEERALARLATGRRTPRGIFHARRGLAWSPGWLMRGAAWAGVAGLALVATLMCAGLRRPQQPDAVVAMIRPSDAYLEINPVSFRRTWPELWPQDRLGAPDAGGWRGSGIQLIGVRPARF